MSPAGRDGSANQSAEEETGAREASNGTEQVAREMLTGMQPKTPP